MSLSSNASNVLLAKCRARFGRHLTAEDVNALVGCRSVGEVAAYLKSCPLYSDMLQDLDDTAVMRRRIEFLLERGFYEQLSTLCRYEMQVGEWFSSYILMKGEIRQIISFLRQLAAGRPDDFIFSLPDFFISSSSLDFARLMQCRTYDDFLAVMEGTHVYKTLRRLAPAPGEPINCAMIEHALYRQYNNEIFDIIKKHYSGAARAELTDLFGTRLDLECFAHIYRLKRYYAADTATIRALIPERTVNIRPRVLFDMISAPDAQQALDIFIARTPYGRWLNTELLTERGIESLSNKLLYKKALRLLRTSVNPTSVLLAYVTLAEIEARDIITIVESVFYKLSPDEIKTLITIDDYTTPDSR